DAASRALAQKVQANLVAATGAKDRGVRKNGFYVLRNTPGPAILVETGFVSNPQEAYRLSDPAYQARIARGIAAGVAQALGRGGAAWAAPGTALGCRATRGPGRVTGQEGSSDGARSDQPGEHAHLGV